MAQLAVGERASSHEVGKQWLDAGRAVWPRLKEAIASETVGISALGADDRGMVEGEVIEAALRDMLRSTIGEVTEWISARSTAPGAAFGELQGTPADWSRTYRAIEVGVARGTSEGWIVRARGLTGQREADGTERVRLLVSAKVFSRHDAWRVAELFSEFFEN